MFAISSPVFSRIVMLRRWSLNLPSICTESSTGHSPMVVPWLSESLSADPDPSDVVAIATPLSLSD